MLKVSVKNNPSTTEFEQAFRRLEVVGVDLET